MLVQRNLLIPVTWGQHFLATISRWLLQTGRFVQKHWDLEEDNFRCEQRTLYVYQHTQKIFTPYTNRWTCASNACYIYNEQVAHHHRHFLHQKSEGHLATQGFLAGTIPWSDLGGHMPLIRTPGSPGPCSRPLPPPPAPASEVCWLSGVGPVGGRNAQLKTPSLPPSLPPSLHLSLRPSLSLHPSLFPSLHLSLPLSLPPSLPPSTHQPDGSLV